MPQTLSSNGIPSRQFGRYDARVSALGFGGHHLGDAADEATAIRLVREAVDGGISLFDNCWEYHRGKSEDWMGKGLKGVRSRVFLMTKVCTHGRDKDLALRMLEQSLRRLQTDHLDLWQAHGVAFDNDPELFIRPNGAAEALTLAKTQGKVRFVGFTGHKDPSIHLKMLNTGFAFDSVQMPLNPFDSQFHSFQRQVLPELTRRGIAALGMKPMQGHGDAIQKGAITAEILRQNLKIAQGFKPMDAAEMQRVRDSVKQYAADGRFELYKLSLKFDNPEARMAHDFPLDMQSVEVKEMLQSTDNNGHPYPEVSH
jgi:aryl-alcohol dehydrogenase-like predicted oxidoreductase